MRQYKERPRYRKTINQLCEDYGWSLSELFEFTSYSIDDPEWMPVFPMDVNPNLKKQFTFLLATFSLSSHYLAKYLLITLLGCYRNRGSLKLSLDDLLDDLVGVCYTP